MITANNHHDPYDDLDSPQASYTDRTQDPKTIEDYIEFIKIGSQIKEGLARETRRQTTSFLLTVLQSMINEQVDAKLLDREVGSYIYCAVKDQAIRKGWID
jgi:hypothetical protein